MKTPPTLVLVACLACDGRPVVRTRPARAGFYSNGNPKPSTHRAPFVQRCGVCDGQGVRPVYAPDRAAASPPVAAA